MKKGDYVSRDFDINEMKSHIEGTVQWVIDGTASIQLPNYTFYMANLKEEPDWVVLHESAPSYQSSVADMTNEQLKASIEALRNQRVVNTTPKVKVRKQRTDVVDKNDPMAVALAGMAPEEKAALMKKLGMVD